MRNATRSQRRCESSPLLFILGSAHLTDQCSALLEPGSKWRMDSAADAYSALGKFELESPSLMLANTELPSGGLDGLQVCRLLKARSASTGIILLLPQAAIESRLAAFQARADDCLAAPVDVRELVARTNALARRCAFSPAFREEPSAPSTPPLPASSAPPSAPAPGSAPSLAERRAAALRARYGLSPREAQILTFLAEGVELKSIGSHVGCEYSSVRTHLRRMAHKLGCSTTREILLRLFAEVPV